MMLESMVVAAHRRPAPPLGRGLPCPGADHRLNWPRVAPPCLRILLQGRGGRGRASANRERGASGDWNGSGWYGAALRRGACGVGAIAVPMEQRKRTGEGGGGMMLSFCAPAPHSSGLSRLAPRASASHSPLCLPISYLYHPHQAESMDAVASDYELAPTPAIAEEARAWLAGFQAHNTEGAALFAMLKDGDRVTMGSGGGEGVRGCGVRAAGWQARQSKWASPPCPTPSKASDTHLDLLHHPPSR